MIITKSNESYFIFSGGEVHTKVDLKDNPSRIICLDYTMNGFMAACEVNQILKRQNLASTLYYPYFPYARQDRVMQENEPFSLKIFCNLVNSQEFDRVTIADPHSDVTPALLDRCVIIPQEDFAKVTIPQTYLGDPETIFVSPDAGAYKKLSKLIKDDKRIAIGVKNRDLKGNITHTDVFSPTSLKGKNCFIVDDICDGGRTFIELAKALRIKQADKVFLYVTHGIFSQGVFHLKENIDHIYTTNSFPNVSSKFLTVRDIV